MVFTYLAEELRTGDIAVAGGAEYGDWSQRLLTFIGGFIGGAAG